MTDAAHLRTEAARGAPRVIVALSITMIGNGLLLTVLGVRSSRAGFSAAVTGSILAAYYVGFLVGARATGAMARRFGLHRTLAAVIVVMASVTAGPALGENPGWWTGLRVVQGFGVSASYVVVETWINASTTNERRGRLLGIYLVTVMAAFALGALLYRFTGADGSWPFLVAALITASGVVPLIGIHPIAATARTATTHMRLGQLFRLAPVGAVVACLSGVVNGAFSSISVYADKAGFSDSRTGVFTALSVIGPILLVYPLGAVSDRVPRPAVLAGSAALAAALFASMVGMSAGGVAASGTIVIAGGLTLGLYMLASAETNDHLRPDQIASASELIVLLYGIGAMVGPFAITAGIAAGGANAYFWVMAAAHGLGAVLVISLWRTAGRARTGHHGAMVDAR